MSKVFWCPLSTGVVLGVFSDVPGVVRVASTGKGITVAFGFWVSAKRPGVWGSMEEDRPSPK